MTPAARPGLGELIARLREGVMLDGTDDLMAEAAARLEAIQSAWDAWADETLSSEKRTRAARDLRAAIEGSKE